MPLIQFPDIPPVPGVPALVRSAINSAESFAAPVLQALDSFGLGTLFGGVAQTRWMIADEDGQPMVIPDSILSFSYKNSAKSGTHPVEAPAGGTGTFAAYNKVNDPFDVSVQFAVSGGNPGFIPLLFGNSKDTRRSALEALEDAVNSTDLFTVITPDAVYTSCSLEHFDYQRRNSEGVSMIVMDCGFMQIRQTAVAAYLNTAAPSASDVQPQGITASQPLSGIENAVYGSLNAAATSLAGPYLGTIQSMASAGKTVINAALNGIPTTASQVLSTATSLAGVGPSAFGAAFASVKAAASGNISVLLPGGIAALRSYAPGFL
jgi:hypothetical protein